MGLWATPAGQEGDYSTAILQPPAQAAADGAAVPTPPTAATAHSPRSPRFKLSEAPHIYMNQRSARHLEAVLHRPAPRAAPSAPAHRAPPHRRVARVAPTAAAAPTKAEGSTAAAKPKAPVTWRRPPARPASAPTRPTATHSPRSVAARGEELDARLAYQLELLSWRPKPTRSHPPPPQQQQPETVLASAPPTPRGRAAQTSSPRREATAPQAPHRRAPVRPASARSRAEGLSHRPCSPREAPRVPPSRLPVRGLVVSHWRAVSPPKRHEEAGSGGEGCAEEEGGRKAAWVRCEAEVEEGSEGDAEAAGGVGVEAGEGAGGGEEGGEERGEGEEPAAAETATEEGAAEATGDGSAEAAPAAAPSGPAVAAEVAVAAKVLMRSSGVRRHGLGEGLRRSIVQTVTRWSAVGPSRVHRERIDYSKPPYDSNPFVVTKGATPAEDLAILLAEERVESDHDALLLRGPLESIRQHRAEVAAIAREHLEAQAEARAAKERAEAEERQRAEEEHRRRFARPARGGAAPVVPQWESSAKHAGVHGARLRDELKEVPEGWSAERVRQVEEAADKFDMRERQLTAACRRILKALREDPTDQRMSKQFQRALIPVYRNRFHVPEKAPRAAPVVRAAGRKAKVEAEVAWSLDESIWKGRPATNDSGAFYDTDLALDAAIDLDWERALRQHSLRDFLLKHDDDGAEAEQAERTLAEVEEEISANAKLLFGLFDYYATVGTAGDPFHVSANGYGAFYEGLELTVPGSKACRDEDMDITFVLANSRSKKDVDSGASKELHVNRSGLSRHEFMQCIARIAVRRYLLSTPKGTPKQKVRDVSSALHSLFNHIRSHPAAPREIFHDPNDFRRRRCYTQEVDSALRTYESSLRTIFSRFAKGVGSTDPSKVKQHTAVSASLLGFTDWMSLCRTFGLIDEDLSASDAELIFIWSRMRVIDAEDFSSKEKTKGRYQVQNLGWHEFLEAMVRLAEQKAIPTDDEVYLAECDDGGHMLMQMRSIRPEAYVAFMRENKREWHQECRQPIARAVHHLLCLIVRTVHLVVAKGSPKAFLEPLTKGAVEKFLVADVNVRDIVVSSSEALKDFMDLPPMPNTVGTRIQPSSTPGGRPLLVRDLGAALDEHDATISRASAIIGASSRRMLTAKAEQRRDESQREAKTAEARVAALP